MKRRRAVALSCALASAPGCAMHAEPSTARSGEALRLSFNEQLRSLNPIYLDGFPGAAIDALAFSYLLRPLPDGRLVRDVALAVPTLANGGIARDGRTITYRLRKDVRWQDGAALTSADVAFTVRAVLNPKNTIGSRDPYDRIARVETPDPFTVRVRLRTPDAAIPGLFLTPDSNAAILPAHLLAGYASLDRVPYNALPVGSGPYRVVSWDRGAALRFAANPSYYGGAPKLRGVELRFVPDTTTTLVQLQTGELDGAIGGDVSLVERYRALPHARLTNVPYTGSTVLGFNTQRPELAAPAMRRALAQAVDVSTLVRQTFRGAVSTSDAGRGLFSYADDPSAPWPHFDPAAAAGALEGLGWKRSAGGTRRRAGRDLALTLVYANNSVATRISAVILQQQFARTGVRVELQSFVYTEFWAHASDGGPVANGRFDLALLSYSSNVDPDVSWLLACRNRAPAGYNEARYCNRRVDGLLDASAREFEPARRIALLQRVQRQVARDLPFVPLWQSREIDVTPLWLDGFVPSGTFPFGSARNWARR